jgi:arylsulfatase A-like enzyme
MGRQLSVLAAAAAAGSGAEAALVACGADRGGQGALHAVWSLGLWAVPSAIVALLGALLLAELCDDQPVIGSLLEHLRSGAARDASAIALLGATLLALGVFAVSRSAAGFHNLELAALLVAALVLGWCALLVALGFVAFRRLQRQRRARTLPDLLWPSLCLAVLGAGALVTLARGGLAQLDVRLVAAPMAFILAFFIADHGRGAGPARPKVALGLALAVLAAVLSSIFVVSGERASAALAGQGAWSPRLMAALRALSDFDHDGHSGWLGGGDCAPFDASIGPDATEVIADGIDNNCIGGDSGKAAPPRRPSWGASAHGSPTNQNLVVVTIETLRYDHASFVRSRRDTTPQLRALAREALVFERMYSAAPLTRLSLATLFSSYAPSEIDWQRLGPEKRMRRIGPATPWLPELLRTRGYETVAVLSDFSAFTSQEDAGFERGFQRYDTSTKLSYRGGTMWGFPAAEQVDKALAHVAAVRRPFLLWLHLFEPHYTYEQPADAPVFGSDDQARYDAEIWHVDRQLGRLVTGLRELGAWDKTVLFVTGDHGEAFGEHDDRWHGSNLFDPQLRPAAMLRIPGVPGKRIDVSVTFSDVAPTLARVLGDRQTFDQLRGRSLAPLLHRARLPDDDNTFIVESFSVDDGHAYQAAVVSHPLKLIYVEEGRKFSLFDLAADPAEQRPLDVLGEPRAAPLMRELVSYLERARPRSLSTNRRR